MLGSGTGKALGKKRVFTIGQGIAATADGPSTAGERGGGKSRFSTSPVTPRTPELTVKPEASPTLKEAVSELTEPFKMALPSFAHHLCVLENCGFVHSKKEGRVRTFTLAPQPLKAAEHWLRRIGNAACYAPSGIAARASLTGKLRTILLGDDHDKREDAKNCKAAGDHGLEETCKTAERVSDLFVDGLQHLRDEQNEDESKSVWEMGRDPRLAPAIRTSLGPRPTPRPLRRKPAPHCGKQSRAERFDWRRRELARRSRRVHDRAGPDLITTSDVHG